MKRTFALKQRINVLGRARRNYLLYGQLNTYVKIHGLRRLITEMKFIKGK